MTDQQTTLLCGYSYDPLDQLVICAPQNQEAVQRFYRRDRLSTEIQGTLRQSLFEHLDQPLAQHSSQSGKVEAWLLATDFQQSVLHSMSSAAHQSAVFCPYGHRTPESGLSSLLGFNGQRRDPVTGHYLLGNGYRAFNPVLMRFNCPDSLSPFGKGGVNGYAYCAGDPVNREDPTGHHFGMVALSGVVGLRRAIRSTVSEVVSDVSQSAIMIGNRAKGLAGGVRSHLQALDSLDQATKAHRMAADKVIQIKESLKLAANKANEAEALLEAVRQNPVTKAPVGSTEYDKELSKPLMAAFQRNREVRAVLERYKDAQIDLFKADRNLSLAQRRVDIREGN